MNEDQKEIDKLWDWIKLRVIAGAEQSGRKSGGALHEIKKKVET